MTAAAMLLLVALVATVDVAHGAGAAAASAVTLEPGLDGSSNTTCVGGAVDAESAGWSLAGDGVDVPSCTSAEALRIASSGAFTLTARFSVQAWGGAQTFPVFDDGQNWALEVSQSGTARLGFGPGPGADALANSVQCALMDANGTAIAEVPLSQWHTVQVNCSAVSQTCEVLFNDVSVCVNQTLPELDMRNDTLRIGALGADFGNGLVRDVVFQQEEGQVEAASSQVPTPLPTSPGGAPGADDGTATATVAPTNAPIQLNTGSGSKDDGASESGGSAPVDGGDALVALMGSLFGIAFVVGLAVIVLKRRSQERIVVSSPVAWKDIGYRASGRSSHTSASSAFSSWQGNIVLMGGQRGSGVAGRDSAVSMASSKSSRSRGGWSKHHNQHRQPHRGSAPGQEQILQQELQISSMHNSGNWPRASFSRIHRDSASSGHISMASSQHSGRWHGAVRPASVRPSVPPPPGMDPATANPFRPVSDSFSSRDSLGSNASNPFRRHSQESTGSFLREEEAQDLEAYAPSLHVAPGDPDELELMEELDELQELQEMAERGESAAGVRPVSQESFRSELSEESL